jgi:hypothetical protein
MSDLQSPPPGDRRPRHRWLIALAAAAAVVALLAALVARSRSSVAPVAPPTTLTTPQPTATTTPAPTAVATTVGPTQTQTATASTVPVPQTVPQAVASSFWESLPDSPLAARYAPLVVALGDEVLVVGGRAREHLNDLLSTRRDGALLNADGTTWRRVADAPVALGGEDVAVWTGSELIALGVDGNALSYEPSADRWQQLGRVIGPPRAYASAVWTGSEMLVAGGLDTSRPRSADQGGGWEHATGSVAFNPSSKSWRTILRRQQAPSISPARVCGRARRGSGPVGSPIPKTR